MMRIPGRASSRHQEHLKIDTQIAGLGEIAAIQDLYVAHSKAAIDGKSASIQQTKTYQIRNCSASTVKVLKSYDR